MLLATRRLRAYADNAEWLRMLDRPPASRQLASLAGANSSRPELSESGHECEALLLKIIPRAELLNAVLCLLTRSPLIKFPVDAFKRLPPPNQQVCHVGN